MRARTGVLGGLTPLVATVVATLRASRDWHAVYQYDGQGFGGRLSQGLRAAGELDRRIAQNIAVRSQALAECHRRRSGPLGRIHRSFTE